MRYAFILVNSSGHLLFFLAVILPYFFHSKLSLNIEKIQFIPINPSWNLNQMPRTDKSEKDRLEAQI